MYDLLSGVLVLILVVLLSLSIWHGIKSASFPRALFFVLTLALSLRIFVSSDIRLHDWDEQYHALVAKNMVSDPLRPCLYSNPVLPYSPQSWVGNHVWLEKPPVALWCMSASVSVFGANTWAIRLPSLIFGLLSVFLTYRIGSLLFDRRIGIFAAYLHAINGAILELGAGRISSDHVETSFIFFVELAVFLSLYSSIKKPTYTNTMLIGCSVGLAFLSKWYPAGIVLPIWAMGFLLFRKGSFFEFIKHGFLILLTAAVFAFPWIYYITHTFPAETDLVLGKYLHAYAASVENHAAPWYYYVHEIMVLFGELIYLVIVVGIYHSVKGQNRAQILVLLTWIGLPLLIFSLGETKRFTYLLMTAPALFMLTGYVWFAVYDTISTTKKQWISYAFLAVLIVLPMRFTLERIKPFENKITTDESFYADLEDYRKKLGPTDVVFNVKENIKLMFFTSVGAAYRKQPTDEEIAELERQGYTVYSMLDGALIPHNQLAKREN